MDDPRVDELWNALASDFRSDAAHLAFIEYCRQTRQLGVACTRYREEVRKGPSYRDDPTRAEMAQKRLDGIVALVMLELQASATPKVEGRSVGHTILKVVAMALCLGALAFLARYALLR